RRVVLGQLADLIEELRTAGVVEVHRRDAFRPETEACLRVRQKVGWLRMEVEKGQSRGTAGVLHGQRVRRGLGAAAVLGQANAGELPAILRVEEVAIRWANVCRVRD